MVPCRAISAPATSSQHRIDGSGLEEFEDRLDRGRQIARFGKELPKYRFSPITLVASQWLDPKKKKDRVFQGAGGQADFLGIKTKSTNAIRHELTVVNISISSQVTKEGLFSLEIPPKEKRLDHNPTINLATELQYPGTASGRLSGSG